MTLSALPTFYPDIQEPESNLADLVYLAANGSPIGRGVPWESDLLQDKSLEGLLVPDILAENRVEMGQQWAVPLILGVQSYRHSGDALKAGLMALFGYMAPLPAAVVYAASRWMAKRY